MARSNVGRAVTGSNDVGRTGDVGRTIYMVGTLASIVFSLYLYLSGRRESGIFVGLWAPTVLQFGETLVSRAEEE